MEATVYSRKGARAMPSSLAPAINPLDYEWKVRAIARGLLGRGLDFEDLVRAGMIGVIRAAETLVPGGPAKSSTYAKKFIRGAIIKAIRDGGRPIRVPHGTLDGARRGQEGGRFDAARRVLGIRFVGEAAFDAEGGLAELVEDRCPGPDSMESAEVLWALVGELPPQEAAIIRGFFGQTKGEEQTPDEIAEFHGLTVAEVHEIVSNAAVTLRRRMGDHERPSPPPEETAIMSSKSRINGHFAPPPANGRKAAPVGCPSCGETLGKRSWCFNPKCDSYRFKKGGAGRTTPTAPPAKLLPAFRDLEAMTTIATTLAALDRGSRDRVVEWAYRMFRPAR
jgi:RNA polymerase sigma factor (sigma-70 family)